MWQLFLEREDNAGPVINDQTFIAIAVVGVGVIAAMAFFGIIFWAGRFQKELYHLNLRIKQARSDRERDYYIRRRKRLYLSIIPFVKYSKKDPKHSHRRKENSADEDQ